MRLSFHLCDTAGDLFGTTAEVHPAEFIQLRLQMVYFTLPVALLQRSDDGKLMPLFS